MTTPPQSPMQRAFDETHRGHIFKSAADRNLALIEFEAGWRAASKGAPVTGGWLPLESAPRDGTEIILRRDNRVTSGHWFSEVEVLGSTYHNNGTYLGEYQTGEVHEACWLSWDGGFSEEHPPTHWQPLPPPPSTKGENHAHS